MTWLAILLFLGLLVLILYLLWKYVIRPSITVSTDKTEYAPGEGVVMSGTYVGPGGVSGKTVNIIVSPPVGDDYVVPSVITDASGGYSTTWTLPGDCVEGTYTVSVSCSGATASATFTQEQIEE